MQDSFNIQSMMITYGLILGAHESLKFIEGNQSVSQALSLLDLELNKMEEFFAKRAAEADNNGQ